MSRDEDLCPVALLCANQSASSDGKRCLPLASLGSPRAQNFKALQTDVAPRCSPPLVKIKTMNGIIHFL